MSGGASGIIGKLVFSGFGLFFAFMGSMFVKQEWKSLQETKAMQAWVQTDCTIETSKTEDAGEDFRLALTYRYEVDGKTFTNDQYGKRRYLKAETIVDIKRAEKKFPTGKTVDGYYNPANPAEAVLDLPTVEGAKKGLGFTLIFPAVGLLFATIPWLRGRKKRHGEPGNKKKELSPKLFLVPFGSIFLLIGLLMIKPLLVEPVQKTRDAKTWDEVPAVVVSSKVKSHSSDDGTTYSPYIAYRYTVEGQEYFGDQYTFMGGSSSGRAAKAEIVRRYPKRKNFTIYVNPVNPAESVITRNASPSLLLGLIPLVFAIVGAVIIVAGFRAKGGNAKLDERQANESVVALKGKSPAAKAIFLTLFACVWGGIVYLISKSDAPMMFFIIFGLFGVGIAAGAVYSILATFNPRPTVEISPGNIRPGTKIAMRWRTNGRTDRISELKITLKCLTVNTETRHSGGKTQTTVVRTPIHEQELLITQKQHEIAHGTLEFQLPEDQPASRPGNHSGIEWQIVFHGDIVRWPDMKAEFPFIVYPTAA
jgi:hypothetical protein